jgi:hypothetical protein
MSKKHNPLNLNPLQLKTLTLLQELALLPEHGTRAGGADSSSERAGAPRPGEAGEVMVSNLPAPHGDHFHVGAYAVAARDATGLGNAAVFVALERKGLIRSLYPMGAVLTAAGIAYETGMREQILHGAHH